MIKNSVNIDTTMIKGQGNQQETMSLHGQSEFEAGKNPSVYQVVEKKILSQVPKIENWFKQRWQETPAPATSSVDLRHAGYKIAPVDTNLFPGGYNNLNPAMLPLGINAAQALLTNETDTKILILPESYTRNRYYWESLGVLRDIFLKAGFVVRIGSLDPTLTGPIVQPIDRGEPLLFEPLIRKDQVVGLHDFNPSLLLLNNDLSTGIPDILKNLSQSIQPTPQLGWAFRTKSGHFTHYNDVSNAFSDLIQLDPWLINALFCFVEDVDFMSQQGIDRLASVVDELLSRIREKYAFYNISDKPYVVVKADSGTHGVSVMMVQNGAQLLQLNRKQRTTMATTKGNRSVNRVIIQEGVYTHEHMSNAAVAEPVVYLINQFVIGGFYRAHFAKGKDENLNAKGVHFEYLAFENACNMPKDDWNTADPQNRFYVYSVIARLAALAAAHEICFA